MKRLNSFLAATLTGLIAVVVLVRSASLGEVDAFIDGGIALMIESSRTGIVDLGSQTLPGVDFLLLFLTNMTGLSLVTLEYLPIAGFGFLVGAYQLTRKVCRSNLCAAFIAGAMAIHVLSPTLSTVWTHTFGFMLFFLFASVWFSPRNRGKWPSLILLWMLFLGIHFYSYTVEFWIVFLVTVLAAYSFLHKKSSSRHSLPKSLFLAILVTFVGFQAVVYRTYIPTLAASPNDFSLGFSQFISSVFRTPSPIPFGWVPPPPSFPDVAAQLAFYVLVFGPIGVVMAKGIFTRVARSARSDIPKALPPVALLLIIWPGDAVAYILIGAAAVGALRYGVLVAPFVSDAIVEQPHSDGCVELDRRKRAITGSYAVALLLISALLLVVATPVDVVSQDRYAEAQPGAQWLLSHAPGTTRIISDQHTQGQFAIYAATAGLQFSPNQLFTPDSFAHLVDPSYSNSEPNYFLGQYVVINLRLAKYQTIRGMWNDFAPLEAYLPTMNANSDLDKVFDSGSIWISTGT